MTSEVPFKRFIIFINLNKKEKKELLSIEFNGLKFHYEQYKELQRKIIKENIKEENKNKTLIPLLPKFELFIFNSFLEEVMCEGDSREDYSYEIEKEINFDDDLPHDSPYDPIIHPEIEY